MIDECLIEIREHSNDIWCVTHKKIITTHKFADIRIISEFADIKELQKMCKSIREGLGRE